MRFHTVIGVFLAIISPVANQKFTEYPFHCRNALTPCQNNGTCGDRGTCTCTENYTGEDCSATTTSTECTPLCQNRGVCYASTDDPPLNLCNCRPGYFNSECQNQIATVICKANTATYSLSIPSGFEGEVYVADENVTAIGNCALVESFETINGEQRKTYTFIANIADDATDIEQACYEKITDSGQTFETFKVNLITHYIRDLLTSIDEFYELNCTHTNEGFEVSTNIERIDYTGNSLNRVNKSEDHGPFGSTFVDNATNPAVPEAILGELLYLLLYLEPDSGYESVVFVNCTVNNTLENPMSSIILLENGCPTERGKFFLTTQTAGSTTITIGSSDVEVNGIVLQFITFKFVSSSQLGITCTAKACGPGDTSCAPRTDCDTTGEGTGGEGTGGEGTGGEGTGGEGTGGEGTGGEGTGGEGTGGEGTGTGGTQRKKRAVDEEQTTVSKVFTVRGRNEITDDKPVTDEQDQSKKSADSVEKCMARAEITAVVAVLGAVVCLLLVVCFLLGCLILKRSGKRVTTYDATTLQPTVDRFHIPRAHVNESYGEL